MCIGHGRDGWAGPGAVRSGLRGALQPTGRQLRGGDRHAGGNRSCERCRWRLHGLAGGLGIARFDGLHHGLVLGQRLAPGLVRVLEALAELISNKGLLRSSYSVGHQRVQQGRVVPPPRAMRTWNCRSLWMGMWPASISAWPWCRALRAGRPAAARVMRRAAIAASSPSMTWRARMISNGPLASPSTRGWRGRAATAQHMHPRAHPHLDQAFHLQRDQRLAHRWA